LARLEDKAEHWVTRDIMRDTIKLYLHDFEIQIRGELESRVKEVALREVTSEGKERAKEMVRKKEKGWEMEEAVKETRDMVNGMEAKMA
jgi:hypothetical protein